MDELEKLQIRLQAQEDLLYVAIHVFGQACKIHASCREDVDIAQKLVDNTREQIRIHNALVQIKGI